MRHGMNEVAFVAVVIGVVFLAVVCWRIHENVKAVGDDKTQEWSEPSRVSTEEVMRKVRGGSALLSVVSLWISAVTFKVSWGVWVNVGVIAALIWVAHLVEDAGIDRYSGKVSRSMRYWSLVLVSAAIFLEGLSSLTGVWWAIWAGPDWQMMLIRSLVGLCSMVGAGWYVKEMLEE